MSNTTDSSLDDIFGSSPPHRHSQTPTLPTPRATVEPSELPSLRRQHVTAGYRDGIASSKAEHVQRGFDAGFPIGAQLGMRAGTILGILEGVVRGYESRAGSAAVRKPGVKMGTTPTKANDKEVDEARRVKREQVLQVYRQAVKELGVQAVFGGLDGKGEEKPEVQLLRKGDKVLSGWEGRVHVAAWEENAMDTLEAKSEHGAAGDSGEKEGVVNGTAGQS
ncbi:Yae1 family protein [Aspergillus lucknowensis]|uniref:Protein YAE1 n=1 Tax=Aspergillus lucknowensis TaxID=176173 RepID=A0ABR4LR77_9EURO